MRGVILQVKVQPDVAAIIKAMAQREDRSVSRTTEKIILAQLDSLKLLRKKAS